jgi:CTP synthase (UTP-ammonia lyase)
VEYARNVLGIPDAEHEETAPQASTPFINRLACSLVGQTQTIRLTRGTRVHEAYGTDEAVEPFRCSFGLNPAYRRLLEGEPLEVVGVDGEGEVRVVELTSHRFFVATLFVPQLTSKPGAPHPLITAFLRAAEARHSPETGVCDL